VLLGLVVAAIALWSQRAEAPPDDPVGRVTPASKAVPGEGPPQETAEISLSDLEADLSRISPNPAETPVFVVTSPASASLEDVIARTLPAVVSVQAGSASGTGFFIRPDVVLTNAHVVGDYTSVQLTVGDQKYSARVTTLSPGTDLAVLQVYQADPRQPTLRLGSVKGLRAGQEVVAIGSALGVLSNTVTRGIVSAVRNTGSVMLIQTDAAINPGNSGGPLVDRSGIVIGVNSMKIAAARGGEGLAFAVAIDHAAQLLGGQASAATATPLQGLNRMMSGGSASDDMREQGAQAYQKALESVAQLGEEIDAYWDRYAKSCVTSAARGGDRSWFAVFEPDGLHISATSGYDCENWLANVRTNANVVRTEVTRATETARRQGVYPGVMRDLRRQHRMEWQGWER
jgi:S1-C subfamily serine protease